MVGVPRSKGCQTCIQRRTKCDESRPACGNCIKYGAACPGYDRSLKFVAGKHAVRSRGRRQVARAGGPKGGASLPDAAPVRLPWRGPDAASSLAVADQSDVFAVKDARGWRAVVTKGRVLTSYERFQLVLEGFTVPLAAPRENIALFIGTLMHSVEDAQRSDELFAFGSWFAAITARLGNKTTLDSAICSFTLHLLGKKNRDEQVIAQSRMLYGQSICALQKALAHPTEWRTPETLSAATILCLFELFAGTVSPDGWMKHAAGVARLMQSRGPKAYERNWERSILLSFRPIIIMDALFSGQQCFLAEPCWQLVIQHHGAASNTLGHAIYDAGVHIVDKYFQLLARLPAVLHRGYALRETNKLGLPVNIGEVMLLTKDAEQLHSEFVTWYPTLLTINPLPTEIPTKDPYSIYPTVLDYPSPWMGALHMGYWAPMLILQECLNQCLYPVDYTESNQLFTLNIMRSIETVGSGMMGAYRCGFSIRIGYEFADERTKRWLGIWLGRFGEHYAATDANTYPDSSWQSGQQVVVS